MSLSPLRLLDHAARLISQPSGTATEEDLRRAISAAYYAVFHTSARAVAELFFWKPDSTHAIFENIYRSPAHVDVDSCCKRYGSLCKKVGAPPNPNIQKFASIYHTLYKKRLESDYKPHIQFPITPTNAQKFVDAARKAIKHFEDADADDRKTFLSLIVFPPRSES